MKTCLWRLAQNTRGRHCTARSHMCVPRASWISTFVYLQTFFSVLDTQQSCIRLVQHASYYTGGNEAPGCTSDLHGRSQCLYGRDSLFRNERMRTVTGSSCAMRMGRPICCWVADQSVFRNRTVCLCTMSQHPKLSCVGNEWIYSPKAGIPRSLHPNIISRFPWSLDVMNTTEKQICESHCPPKEH